MQTKICIVKITVPCNVYIRMNIFELYRNNVRQSDRDMQHCHFLKSTCNIGDPQQGPLFSHSGMPHR